jgi:hypothetical protein
MEDEFRLPVVAFHNNFDNVRRDNFPAECAGFAAAWATERPKLSCTGKGVIRDSFTCELN